MDIPGKVYDLYRHVVKTCPFFDSTKPRSDRSRASGLRAEEFGDLIFLDHGSTNIGNQTCGFLIVLDGATYHVKAYQCKSTSPSVVISKLHEWMDTFPMNPKAICVDVAFHEPHDMQAFYRMHCVTLDHTLLSQIELKWVSDSWCDGIPNIMGLIFCFFSVILMSSTYTGLSAELTP